MFTREFLSTADHAEVTQERNCSIIDIGRRTGEAIVSGIGLVHTVYTDWHNSFPFSHQVFQQIDAMVSAVSKYCECIDPPDELGNQHDTLSHHMKTLYLNLHPEVFDDAWREYTGRERPTRLWRVLGEFEELLTETFSLPPLDDDQAERLMSASLSEQMAWAGAPEGAEGLRFIPGYSRLEWGKADGQSGELSIVYRDDIPLDIIHFRKKGGREFFVTSTGGLLSLDYHLKGIPQGEKVSVIGVTYGEKIKEHSKPAAVIDRDGTIAFEGMLWSEDPQEMQDARAAFFRSLDAHDIPHILWSKNRSVSFMYKELAETLDIPFAYPITYENWPFFDRESDGWELDESQLTLSFNALPAELRDEIALFAQANFAAAKDQSISSYIHVIREEIMSFLQFHVGRLQTNKTPYYFWDPFLEARAPLFVALTQNQFPPEIRRRFLKDGVLINDKFASVVGAKIFGYSFIHVDHPTHIDSAGDILAFLCG